MDWSGDGGVSETVAKFGDAPEAVKRSLPRSFSVTPMIWNPRRLARSLRESFDGSTTEPLVCQGLMIKSARQPGYLLKSARAAEICLVSD